MVLLKFPFLSTSQCNSHCHSEDLDKIPLKENYNRHVDRQTLVRDLGETHSFIESLCNRNRIRTRLNELFLFISLFLLALFTLPNHQK